nr:hypothetical protein [Escherichia coli]
MADALTRAARHRGVLVTSNAVGELVFTQAGSKQTDTLVLGENLLEAIYNDDPPYALQRIPNQGHGRGGGKSGDSAKPASLSAPVGW